MATQEKATHERKILVIDDDRVIQATLGGWLERHGLRVAAATTAAAGLAALAREEPDVVLLDLGLPDAGGLETLDAIHTRAPQVAVIIVTAQDSLDNAIESIKRGAFHFISKPYVPEELLSLVRRAAEKQELVRETAHLRSRAELLSRKLELAQHQLEPGFSSGLMKEIDALIRRVAPTDANVFLIGESGVGKEVMANRLHRLSRRCDRPMVRLNCAAFPTHLIEGELFGYVKGAFTGAVADFPGMIAQAEGGTLFLDEIVEMPVDLQTRFLRALQEREFRPLGSTRTIRADFRLIAATNRPVADALRDGVLRRDLYYRINTFQVEIPPLRDRKEDIPALVTAFLNQFACRQGKPPPQITPEAFARLTAYDWPGNIRELQNAIEYGVVLACDERVTEKELPKELLAPALSTPASGTTFHLETLERNAIILALTKTSGNKKKAAQLLGIHRPTLYSKMKRHRILL